jgi:hypothetical protein
MMYCNFMEHDMRAAVLAIIGLVGLNDNSHDRVRFPGRISLERSRRRVVSRRGRSGLRPWLSLGRQTSQPIWRMGSGALRKERSYMSETLARQVFVAFRFE